MKILCVFGKYAYGDPRRGIGTEYASFIPALRRIGHEVIHFDSWDRSKYNDFGELNADLVRIVDCQRPDMVLVVQKQYEIWLETLELLMHRGDVITVCWATDDSWKYRECSRLVGRYYDVMVTTCPSAVPKYLRDGIANVLLSQWAANAEWLHEPLPASSCRYPISFVGAAHGRRRAWVEALRRRGLEVHCFGYGWEHGPVDPGTIPKIVGESVISLNFANSRGQNQIKARTFEVPGAGGFLLTQGADSLDRYYKDGEEIVVFEGIEDLVAKARYFLSHPGERDRIAKAGYERTRREHTYDQRMREVVQFALQTRERVSVSHRSKADEPRPLSPRLLTTHRVSLLMRLFRWVLVSACSAIWGPERGPRAARRLLYELSWRLCGRRTYSAVGWPGRLFYRES